MRKIKYQTVTGEWKVRQIRTGPVASGYVRVQVRVPPAYMAAMEGVRERSGVSVNEQVRRAIRMQLTEGLLYKPVCMGLLKQ